MNKKLNLVLIQPYAANSEMLKNLISYLNEFFNVYYVDLPGFCKDLPPLEKITTKNFAEYTTAYISTLNLDSYILGGISFGFMVLSNMEVDSRCKGVLAIEPCLGGPSLNGYKYEKSIIKQIANFIMKKNLGDTFLQSDLPVRLGSLFRLNPGKSELLEYVRNNMDSTTLVGVAKILFTEEVKGLYKKELPHVLIMNVDDKRVNYNYVVHEFSQDLPDLLILRSYMPHRPENFTKEYFKKYYPEDLLMKVKKHFVSRQD